MRALNFSGVLDETTEGRLFQTGIVLGKNEFFRASTISKVSGVLKFVRFPGTSNVWSRGQILIFVKRHCTIVNLVEEG